MPENRKVKTRGQEVAESFVAYGFKDAMVMGLGSIIDKELAKTVELDGVRIVARGLQWLGTLEQLMKSYARENPSEKYVIESARDLFDYLAKSISRLDGNTSEAEWTGRMDRASARMRELTDAGLMPPASDSDRKAWILNRIVECRLEPVLGGKDWEGRSELASEIQLEFPDISSINAGRLIDSVVLDLCAKKGKK